MQSARRSEIPSRCSIAASSNIPASEVIRPPSKVKCTGLPATGGKPGRIPVPSSMAAQTPLASIGPALATESYVEPMGYVAPASPLRQTDELSRLAAIRSCAWVAPPAAGALWRCFGLGVVPLRTEIELDPGSRRGGLVR